MVYVALNAFGGSSSHSVLGNGTTSSPSAVGSASSSSTSPQSSDATPVAPTSSLETTPATVPTEPPLPSTASHIALSAVRHSPLLRQVATMLDTYFSGINAHDPATAASIFTTNGPVDPDNPDSVASFGTNIRTTHDDHIVVRSIRNASFSGRPGALLHVTFRSRQAGSLGPRPGEKCTHWNITYKTLREPGELKTFGSQSADSTAC